ncbi:MAG: hypothetical protein QNJ53_07805 [Pleurocapsa sp. MO_192.B19]|nr:hypothetical protein [Pleurocapsa sp. MO_192.B19]
METYLLLATPEQFLAGENLLLIFDRLFTKRRISSVAGDVDGPYGSYVADVDSDGDLDVMAADQFDNDIVWWEMQNISLQLQ